MIRLGPICNALNSPTQLLWGLDCGTNCPDLWLKLTLQVLPCVLSSISSSPMCG